MVGIREGDGKALLSECRDAKFLLRRASQYGRIILFRSELRQCKPRLKPPAVDSFDSEVVSRIFVQGIQRKGDLLPWSIARSIELRVKCILGIGFGDLLRREIEVILDRQAIILIAHSEPREMCRGEGDVIDMQLCDLCWSLLLILSEDSRGINIATAHTSLIAGEGIDILRLERTE